MNSDWALMHFIIPIIGSVLLEKLIALYNIKNYYDAFLKGKYFSKIISHT